MDCETAFCESLAHFRTKYAWFSYVRFKFFCFISGSESGGLGFQNQVFGVGGLAEASFSYWDSVDLGVDSSCFFCCIWTNFDDFAFAGCLKFGDF